MISYNEIIHFEKTSKGKYWNYFNYYFFSRMEFLVSILMFVFLVAKMENETDILCK